MQNPALRNHLTYVSITRAMQPLRNATSGTHPPRTIVGIRSGRHVVDRPMPTRVGQYELVRRVAQGGMADIYLARQDGLERDVAVKVLNVTRAADPDARTLFRDEARVLAMLSHANLAGVYEIASE